MLHPKDRPEAIQRFCTATGNVARELIEAGVGVEAIAAGIRMEAAKIEADAPRHPMEATERELVDLARKAHEFINTLQVAGIDERTAITCILNALIERLVRAHGPKGAADFLRRMGDFTEQHGDSLTQTSGSH